MRGRIKRGKFRVNPGYEVLNKAAATKAAAGAHLWIVLVTYGLTSQEAALASEGVHALLDQDHLLGVTGIGCFNCEERYDKAVGKPCRGPV